MSQINEEPKPKTKTLQRYKWEDSLIKAQTIGYITNGALLTALKLAGGMNWTKGGILGYDNDSACVDYGIGRTTFYAHRKELIESGYLGRKSGNYFAKLPTIQNEYEKKVNDKITARLLKIEEKKKKIVHRRNLKRFKSGFRTDESGNDIVEYQFRTQ
jgi:hypothetical protein